MSGPGGQDVTVGIKTNADTGPVNQYVAALNQLTAEMNRSTATMNAFRQASTVMGEQAAKNSLEWVKNAQSAQEYDARLRSLQAATNNLNASTKTSTGVGQDFDNMMSKAAKTTIGLITSYVGLQAVLGTLRAAWNDVTAAIDMAIQKTEQFLQDSFQLADQAQRMEYLWSYQYGGPQGGGPQIAAQTAAWLPNFAMKSPYTLMEIMGAVGPLSQLNLSFQGLQRYLPLISDLASTHTSIFGGGGPLPISYAALAVMEATKGYSRRLLMELQIRPNELAKYGLKFVGDKESGQLANPEMFLPALEAYAKDKGYTGASAKMATETIWGLGASLTDRFQAFQRRLMGENIPDPNAGSLTPETLALIKAGDIAGAMKAAGADQASLKSYGVAFNKSGGVKDVGAFQDALQQFSQDKFYAGLANGQQFRGGTIFDVILGAMKDFSHWWDDHQSTFDKISKFVAEVGGKLLTVGRNSISSIANGFVEGFSKDFKGGDKLAKLGGDFLSWITDPKNQDMLKQGATWLGANLGNSLTIVADDLDKLRIAWDNIPDDWKKNGAALLGGAIENANIFMQELLIGTGRFFDTVRGLGDWFKEHDFFEWRSNNQQKSLQFVKDLLQLTLDFKRVLSDPFNDKLYQQISKDIQQATKDLQNFFDATTNAEGNHAGGSGFGKGGGKGGGKGPPTGHGPNVDPNAYAASFGPHVTQNNTYNIQGSTQWNIQQLINSNARKVNNVQSRLWQSPGALAFGSVGLF